MRKHITQGVAGGVQQADAPHVADDAGTDFQQARSDRGAGGFRQLGAIQGQPLQRLHQGGAWKFSAQQSEAAAVLDI